MDKEILIEMRAQDKLKEVKPAGVVAAKRGK